MLGKNKTGKLETRKLELIRNIEALERFKKETGTVINELNKQHQNRAISYNEYSEKLNKIHESGIVEKWNDYSRRLDEYRQQLEIINRRIEEGRKININPLLVVLGILMIVGIGIFFLDTEITGRAVQQDTITFDRDLSCDRCGQHKAPPSANVSMIITAEFNGTTDNDLFIDYYPVDWVVVDENGGTTEGYNGQYNRIVWNVSGDEGVVTRTYTIISPGATTPTTDYDFYSELANVSSDMWHVVVSDAPARVQNKKFVIPVTSILVGETTTINASYDVVNNPWSGTLMPEVSAGADIMYTCQTGVGIRLAGCWENIASCSCNAQYNVTCTSQAISTGNLINWTIVGCEATGSVTYITTITSGSDALTANNSDTLTVNANTVPPAPNLNLPTNYTNFSYSTPELNWSNTTQPDAGQSITYGLQVDNNNNFASPEWVRMIAETTNVTRETTITGLADGEYFWRVNATDGTDWSAFSNHRRFTIDTTAPRLNVTAPLNNSNTSSASVALNISLFDTTTNINSCWYNLNLSTVNTTLANCANTTLSLAEGRFNITIYTNDTVNRVNQSDRIFFTIDTTVPRLNVTAPLNNSNTSSASVALNFAASDALTSVNTCWYNLNASSVNITLADCANTTLSNFNDGQHNVTVYANDTVNNVNQSNIIFFRRDTAAPRLNVTSPLNNSNTSSTSVDLNFSLFDTTTNINTCWYNLNLSTVNTTIANCANTTLSLAEGRYNVTVYTNDTVNNVNQSDRLFFRVDTTAPTITSAAINASSSVALNTSVKVNASVTDATTNVNVVTLEIIPPTLSAYNLTATKNGDEYYNNTVMLSEKGMWRFRFYANDSLSNNATGTLANDNNGAGNDHINVSNTAPTIAFVDTINSPQTINEGTALNITFSYNVSDMDGVSDLNSTTAFGSFNGTGGVTRSNSSCAQTSSSGRTAMYNCTVDLWYFDPNGLWTVNVTIADNDEAVASNIANQFSISQTIALVVGPNSLGWPNVELDQQNISSNNDPIIINNTGNANITAGNVQVDVYNLYGANEPIYVLPSLNISISTTDNCIWTLFAGYRGSNASTISTPTANVTRGNNTLNFGNATSGQEELYFCLLHMPTNLSTQRYTSVVTWTIRLV